MDAAEEEVVTEVGSHDVITWKGENGYEYEIVNQDGLTIVFSDSVYETRNGAISGAVQRLRSLQRTGGIV